MKPSVRLVLAHLVLVYISWGSTYIGLKFSQEVLGPFFVCGMRMLLGGLLYALVLRLGGKWRPVPAADLRHAALSALLLVVAASGFLSKGQETIDSAVAGVVVGSTPITMLLAGWLFAGEERPSLSQCFGLLAGLCGLILLGASHGGAEAGDGVRADPAGIAWVLAATLGWVAGSLIMRKRPHRTGLSPQQSCALLLIAGGLESLLVGLCCGELGMTRPENLRPAVLLAFSWMVVGGSILAYSSYFWLLRHTSLAVAVSYEYVVPVIGLFLGWLLGGETVTVRMLAASCLTLGSAFLVMRGKRGG